MKLVSALSLLLAFANSLPQTVKDTESQIKAVLNLQVDAWNRGDIPAFVGAYASDCIFVGKEIAHGRDQLLARYEKTYPTREAMGRLTFSALEVHPLTTEVVIVTGEWHIVRASAAGKPTGGLFSLVFRRQREEWKIVLDHTS